MISAIFLCLLGLSTAFGEDLYPNSFYIHSSRNGGLNDMWLFSSYAHKDFEHEIERQEQFVFDREVVSSKLSFNILKTWTLWSMEVGSSFISGRSKVEFDGAVQRSNFNVLELPWLKFFRAYDNNSFFYSLTLAPGVSRENRSLGIRSGHIFGASWGYLQRYNSFRLAGDISLYALMKSRNYFVANETQYRNARSFIVKNIYVTKSLSSKFDASVKLSGQLYTGSSERNPTYRSKIDRGYGINLEVGLKRKFSTYDFGLRINTSSIIMHVFSSTLGADFENEEEKLALMPDFGPSSYLNHIRKSKS